MFAALARFTNRRRWWVFAGTGILLVGVAAVLLRGGTLTTGAIEGTESARAQQLLKDLAGLSGDSVIAAVLGMPEQGSGELSFTDALRSVVERVKRDPDVQSVASPLDGPPQLAVRFLSEDGRHALVLIRAKGDLRAAAQAFPRIREQLRAGPLEAAVTGKPAFLKNL